MGTTQYQTTNKKSGESDVPSLEIGELAASIHEAGLSDSLVEALSDLKYTDGSRRHLYTLYLGIDQHLTTEVKRRISGAIGVLTKGYTLVESFGKFRETEEKSTLIQLGVENPEIAYKCADNLRREFDQNGVGIVADQTYKRIVSENQRLT